MTEKRSLRTTSVALLHADVAEVKLPSVDINPIKLKNNKLQYHEMLLFKNFLAQVYDSETHLMSSISCTEWHKTTVLYRQ